MQSYLADQEQKSQKSQRLQFELTSGVQSEERELIRLFQVFLQQDQKIEDFKIRLSSCEEFNLLDLFQCFDQDSNNFISYEEFLKQLKLMGVKLQNDQIKVFFKRYIRHGIREINFKDFSSIFLPFTLRYRKTMLERGQGPYRLREQVRMKEAFGKSTISLLAFILETSILNECNNEDLRIKLFAKKHLNFKRLFMKHDLNQDGIWEF